MHRLSIAIPSPNCPNRHTRILGSSTKSLRRSTGRSGNGMPTWTLEGAGFSLFPAARKSKGDDRAILESFAWPCHERLMEANMPQNCQKTLDQSESGVHKCLQMLHPASIKTPTPGVVPVLHPLVPLQGVVGSSRLDTSCTGRSEMGPSNSTHDMG